MSIFLDKDSLSEIIACLTKRVGGRSKAAKIMGVAPTTLDNYRLGKTHPKFLEVLELSNAANISIADLINVKTAVTTVADLDIARTAISKTPLGKRLTAVRKAIGFSQRTDLARFLKINPETLGSYERGESIPDPDFFSRYKQIWSVNLNWLLTGEGEMFLKSKLSEERHPSEDDINAEQLAVAIEAVEEGLRRRRKRNLPALNKAKLIQIAYGMVRSEQDVSKIIRLVSAA